ncbi:MAG: hypothetical protein IT208_11360 [Chthonomonadales bacterium]|nr:hypothetical protein [Chthonomonadales bacterium]
MLVSARYYDAQAGRFVTRDTLLGEHPYLYCEHEPVGYVDPSGHSWWGVVGSIGGSFVGGAVGSMFGPAGTAVGARIGGVIGGAIGAHYGDGVPLAPAIGQGIVGAVLTPGAGKVGGKLVGMVIKRPPIAPLSRANLWVVNKVIKRD